MGETVLVTAAEYAKGQAIFQSQTEWTLLPAPADPDPLADAIRTHRARCVILGPEPYPDETIYAALAQAAGSGGAGHAASPARDAGTEDGAPIALIARFGVGCDGVHREHLRRHAIALANTPGVLDVSVAEHTVWLLGALARHVAPLHAGMLDGRWAPRTGTELHDKTLGLLGLGRIGRHVARICGLGLGMRVLAVGRSTPDELEVRLGMSMRTIRATLGLADYTTDPHAVLPAADAVSLHLPVSETTRGFLGAQRLAAMKPGALLVNTARGSLVDEPALYDALASGRLGGAALDVFTREPYQPAAPDKDLRTLPNVLLTPHVGSNTRECNARMAARCLDNVRAFLGHRLDQLARVV